MPIQIPTDHSIFLLKSKVQEVSQNFLTSFGFSYFQYLRCFADGSVGLLTNNTGLIEYIEHMDNTPLVFSSYGDEHENTYSYWFLWDETLPAMPVQIAREKLNIRNGLTLVRRTKNYYDMIAVALSNEQANPGSFYLNKMDAIKQFIQEFDRDNKDLIQVMNKTALVLPEPCRDVNYKDMCLHKGKINVMGRQGQTYITAQELSCLGLLLQGMSYKQIAQIIEISPRTVETYIHRIKQRTQYSSFGELERKLRDQIMP